MFTVHLMGQDGTGAMSLAINIVSLQMWGEAIGNPEKTRYRLGIAAHTFNPSTMEAEIGGFEASLEMPREALSQEKEEEKGGEEEEKKKKGRKEGKKEGRKEGREGGREEGRKEGRKTGKEERPGMVAYAYNPNTL